MGNTILYSDVCSNAHENGYFCLPCGRLLRTKIETFQKSIPHYLPFGIFDTVPPLQRMAELMLRYSLLFFSLTAKLRNILIEADRSALTGMRRIGDE